jgi:hypothetical protein
VEVVEGGVRLVKVAWLAARGSLVWAELEGATDHCWLSPRALAGFNWPVLVATGKYRKK